MAQQKVSIRLLLLLLLIPGVFFLSGCDNKDYLIKKTFEGGCWSVSDSLSVDLELSGDQTLPLVLEFTPEYAYQNIYLKLIYTDASGAKQELLINQLLSDKLGNWQQELSGSTYSFELPEAIKLQVKNPGKFHLTLFHYMREDQLCGIEKVGILTP